MKTFVANLSVVEVPKTVNEAMKKPEWKAALMEEIHALGKNGTWEVVKSQNIKLQFVVNGCLQLNTIMMER